MHRYPSLTLLCWCCWGGRCKLLRVTLFNRGQFLIPCRGCCRWIILFQSWLFALRAIEEVVYHLQPLHLYLLVWQLTIREYQLFHFDAFTLQFLFAVGELTRSYHLLHIELLQVLLTNHVLAQKSSGSLTLIHLRMDALSGADIMRKAVMNEHSF